MDRKRGVEPPVVGDAASHPMHAPSAQPCFRKVPTDLPRRGVAISSINKHYQWLNIR